MSEDLRIKDLQSEIGVGGMPAAVESFLAVDMTGYTDAKKLKLSTLLTTAIVAANTNASQAMTPKAFYDSVMTESRRGVARQATDQEVTDRTGEGVVIANKVVRIKNKIQEEFYQQGNNIQVYHSAYWSIAWTACVYHEQLNAGVFNSLICSPIFAAPIVIGYINYVFASNQHVNQGTLALTSSVVQYTIGGGAYFILDIPSQSLRVGSSVVLTNVRISITGNGVIQQ
jgi:hypothetical protein